VAQGSGEVGATSDEIRSQIEQTRGEMSDTIDAIQSRLSPTRVFADAKDSVTEATVERVRRLNRVSRGVVLQLQRMQDKRLAIALLATAAGLLVRSVTIWRRRRRERTRTVSPVHRWTSKTPAH
jgi:Protein of unknown function (DUF3618)